MVNYNEIKTGADLKSLRQSLALSQQACADLVHVTLNAWQKWEDGTRPINKTALELFLIKTQGGAEDKLSAKS